MVTGVPRSDPGPRCIALIGPYLGGKTTLLESILHICGATTRKGSVTEGNTVGDSSPEARAHQMSVEANVASCTFLDDRFTFIDCPGSIELLQESLNALCAVDAAIVVCEPTAAKLLALQPYLKHLQDMAVPHFLFVNKIDQAQGRVRDLLQAIQPASTVPLVLRQVPIWENGIATGFIDLALERAHVYREHAASEVVDLNGNLAERKSEARYQMLEQLADFDDSLMEELLEDIDPPRDEIFDNLSRDFRDCQIVPVLLGSAENDNGVRRLLKALRHEVPGVAATATRMGVEPGEEPLCQVIKTYHSAQGGKLSVLRVLQGSLKDGDTVYAFGGDQERVSSILSMLGQQTAKLGTAGPGDTVAVGRMESIRTSDTLSTDKASRVELQIAPSLAPVFSLAIQIDDRKDEVKLSGTLARINEEDPSIITVQVPEMNETLIQGQGEMHLRLALERLRNRFGLDVHTEAPKVPYREAIRKPTKQRGKHKRQSGGHGQFGDVVLEISPLPRGSGFAFEDRISGGVVPRQYIPAVEAGVKDAMVRGPLGFPVVDVAVALVDGSYHSVDSSEQAFRTAGRIGMQAALPNCAPVLLEPVAHVSVVVPSEATPKVNAILSARRGHILGFDTRAGWSGWDQISAELPQAELHDLIIELRSASHGVGSYSWTFDHLQELTGNLAEKIVAEEQAA